MVNGKPARNLTWFVEQSYRNVHPTANPSVDFATIAIDGRLATCITHSGRTVVLTLQHYSFD